MVKGNLLSTNVFGEHYLDAHVIFKVHNSFNINWTIKYFIPNTNEKFSGKACVRFYEGNNIWDIIDSDFPWSVVKNDSFIRCSFYYVYGIIFEYNIAPRYNSTKGVHSMSTILVSFYGVISRSYLCDYKLMWQLSWNSISVTVELVK